MRSCAPEARPENGYVSRIVSSHPSRCDEKKSRKCLYIASFRDVPRPALLLCGQPELRALHCASRPTWWFSRSRFSLPRVLTSSRGIHFLLASSFISCHNWSTARRRRAVRQNWKTASIATLGFFLAPSQFAGTTSSCRSAPIRRTLVARAILEHSSHTCHFALSRWRSQDEVVGPEIK
jgi:hypothetical protein